MKTEPLIIADMLPTLSQVGGALIGGGFIVVVMLAVAYFSLRENEKNARRGYYANTTRRR